MTIAKRAPAVLTRSEDGGEGRRPQRSTRSERPEGRRRGIPADERAEQ